MMYKLAMQVHINVAVTGRKRTLFPLYISGLIRLVISLEFFIEIFCVPL